MKNYKGRQFTRMVIHSCRSGEERKLFNLFTNLCYINHQRQEKLYELSPFCATAILTLSPGLHCQIA